MLQAPRLDSSQRLQRLGSLMHSGEQPASSLPPILRPPSLTSRRGVRITAAGGTHSHQRASDQDLEEVQYALSAPSGTPAPALQAGPRPAAATRAAAAQQHAEEDAPSTPSASTSIFEAGSPAAPTTPGSGCSSGSGRSARPLSRRWVRQPTPQQQQRQRDCNDEAATRPKQRTAADSPGLLARGFSSQLEPRRHINGAKPASLDDQQQQHGDSHAAEHAQMMLPAGGGNDSFAAPLDATPPPLAAGLRRLTSLRQPGPPQELSDSCASIDGSSVTGAQPEAGTAGSSPREGGALDGGAPGPGSDSGGENSDAAATPATTAGANWNPMQQPTPAASSVARLTTKDDARRAPASIPVRPAAASRISSAVPPQRSRFALGGSLGAAAAGLANAAASAAEAQPISPVDISPVDMPRLAAPPAPLSQQSACSEAASDEARTALPRLTAQDQETPATPPAAAAHPDTEVRFLSVLRSCSALDDLADRAHHCCPSQVLLTTAAQLSCTYL